MCNGFLKHPLLEFLMNTTINAQTHPSGPPAPAPRWASVAVLVTCLLAIASTVVHIRQRPEPVTPDNLPWGTAQQTRGENMGKNLPQPTKNIRQMLSK
jgi:hypothetical protein